MRKSYKTEIDPTPQQKQKINKTIGTCRFVYNFFISHNKEIYETEKRYVSEGEFRKWMNNEFIPNNEEFKWIKEAYSKAVTQSVKHADHAFKKFFNNGAGFPRFKKKNKSDVKMYFVKNNKTDCLCERHRIKIPTLGWVKIKEKGYIPTNQVISSGTVSKRAGRYYVSVVVSDETQDVKQSKDLNDFGIGIDLGVKDFAVISDGTVKKNINKTAKMKKLEKKLKREQRSLSRKYEDFKKRNKEKKGEATRQNIQKQVLKVQKIHKKMDDIRTDYINKTINEIVKTKPSYITIEDLNVTGMMKNRHLSKAVATQKFYEFRTKLEAKCKENGIELRIVDRWYPSSKMCNKCGNIKKDLKLSDRKYVCTCGHTADRDYNASLNLRDAKTYKVAQ